MPLLDHFHPPLAPDHHCESFHSNWATRIADALNDILPEEFLAEEFTHSGARLEIDVATYENSASTADARAGGIAMATAAAVWSPPAATCTISAVFSDTFEVRVFQTTAGRTLVAAVELVSPGNKDRAAERRAFAAKCASYLTQGVSLLVVDIVTNRRANLHDEVLALLTVPAPNAAVLAADAALYAVSYRPVERDEEPQLDLWIESLSLGAELPTMPLRLTGDLFVPVKLEATYAEACRRRRLV